MQKNFRELFSSARFLRLKILQMDLFNKTENDGTKTEEENNQSKFHSEVVAS
jgi:hypothetical protein